MLVKTPVDGVISEEALKFSQEQGIEKYVKKAMHAVREVFTDGEPISATLGRDPEYGYLYVEIHVLLHENEQPEAAAEKDSACYGKWAEFMPPEVGNISLSTSWASR